MQCLTLGKDPALELCEVAACPLLGLIPSHCSLNNRVALPVSWSSVPGFHPFLALCLKEARQGGGAAVQTGRSAAPGSTVSVPFPVATRAQGVPHR